MSSTVLDSIALGYQPLWNADRQLAAVRLLVHSVKPDAVDAAHLMRALGGDWPVAAPPLILSFDAPALLGQALRSEPVDNTWLACPADAFDQPESLAVLSVAHRRGHGLLRHVPAGQAWAGPMAPLDARTLVHVDAGHSLALLQALSRAQPTPQLVPGHAYAGIGNRRLADHCLDTVGVWALLGWPDEDVLQTRVARPLACDSVVIEQVLQGVREETSLEHLERLVRQDPVLVYRLLLLVNSAAYNTRSEIGSIRHALMMMGLTSLGAWVQDQRRGADEDIDLHPVRYAMVMRSRLAQHMLAPGSGDDLRAEVYLSALFSQLDRLMHQPLPELLARVPVSGRVLDAALRHDGPYHPLMDLAAAQGDPAHLHELPHLCHMHEFPLEDANRALIRMLATSRDHNSKRSQRMP
ncbi:MAG: HDOD domain-containing protein [Burkholderiaceae bacterium]